MHKLKITCDWVQHTGICLNVRWGPKDDIKVHVNALIIFQNVTGLLYGSFTLAKILCSEFETPSKWPAQGFEAASATPTHMQSFKVLHHWWLGQGGSQYPLALDHMRLGGITLVVIRLHDSSSSTLYLLLLSPPHYPGNSRWRKQLEKHECLPHLHPRTRGHIRLSPGIQCMPAT